MTPTLMLHRACALGILVGVAATSRPVTCQATQASRSSPAARLSHEDSGFVVLEHAMWSALRKHDTASFVRASGLGAVDVDVSGARRVTPASTAQYVARCQVASSVLENFQVVRDSMTVVVTYTATVDETCWGQKAPSPVYVLSVYERADKGWRLLAHSETPAVHW